MLGYKILISAKYAEHVPVINCPKQMSWSMKYDESMISRLKKGDIGQDFKQST